MKIADIFTVDGHGNLVLDKEYIRGIPEYKTILERKLPTEGDYDGRKKVANWQLFMYIKIVADRFTYPNMGGFEEKEVHEAAIKEAKLDAKYKPDKEILAAIDKFIQIQDDLLPTLKTVHNVRKGIKMSDKIAQQILLNMESQHELYFRRIKEAEDRGETVNEADQVLLVDKMLAQLTNIQKIAIKMPEIVDSLDALEERLTKETAGDKVARGGRKIGNRAIPKR